MSLHLLSFYVGCIRLCTPTQICKGTRRLSGRTYECSESCQFEKMKQMETRVRVSHA